jgi:hypothetical protein
MIQEIIFLSSKEWSNGPHERMRRIARDRKIYRTGVEDLLGREESITCEREHDLEVGLLQVRQIKRNQRRRMTEKKFCG